jgi:hypothetical protein
MWLEYRRQPACHSIKKSHIKSRGASDQRHRSIPDSHLAYIFQGGGWQSEDAHAS